MCSKMSPYSYTRDLEIDSAEFELLFLSFSLKFIPKEAPDTCMNCWWPSAVRHSSAQMLWWWKWGCPHRLTWLNTSSPVGRTVWEQLGSLILQEVLCRWSQVWGFKFSCPSQCVLSVFCMKLERRPASCSC